jgi:dihydrofolate synthase/folylpolyglutamate synthase
VAAGVSTSLGLGLGAESEALAWLYSLADQERGVGWNPRASPDSQWKLGRTRALLDLAGAPDRRLRLALVAGTKGKGSTSAMLASILGAAGVRCGLYTKPHLQSYRERIRIDGQAISPYAFARAVDRMRRCVASLPSAAGEPTTFEVTTALALDQFAKDECEMAVIEVGLGGRLDATNATEPFVSVVTSISYDHTAILGRTLGAIASEKAGILRPGRPALLALQRPAAWRALRHACREVGANCQVLPPLERELSLAGTHQRQNAALAVAAARVMSASVDDAAIELGLRRLRWPGRFEILDGSPPVVLDGAHNGASAAALAETLETFAGGRPISLVVGINRDKDARAVLRPLVRLAHSVWATQASGNPRALEAVALAQLCRRLGAAARVAPDVSTALEEVAATTPRGLICVTGSLMLVGQARATLGLAAPEQLW